MKSFVLYGWLFITIAGSGATTTVSQQGPFANVNICQAVRAELDSKGSPDVVTTNCWKQS